VETRARDGNLCARGAGAARVGSDVAEAVEQRREALVDDFRIEDCHIGARALGVESAAVRAKARAACRTADVQA